MKKDPDEEPIPPEEEPEEQEDVSELPDPPESITLPEESASRRDANYDIIRSALESHLMDYAKKKNEQKRNIEQLSSTIEEFMDSFILLGYNYDGEPMTIVSASNQQQADSLSTALQKFIVSSQGDPSGGSFM
jgi:hypothetical protein